MQWPFGRDGIRFAPAVHIAAVCNDIDTLAAVAVGVAGAGVTRLSSSIAHPLIAAGPAGAVVSGRRRTGAGACRPGAFGLFGASATASICPARCGRSSTSSQKPCRTTHCCTLRCGPASRTVLKISHQTPCAGGRSATTASRTGRRGQEPTDTRSTQSGRQARGRVRINRSDLAR